MSELEGNVIFTKNTSVNKVGERLEVPQELVTLKIRQTGTITVEFRGLQEEVSRIMGFFETMVDMEPLTMNISSTGPIEGYFKGTNAFVEEVGPGRESVWGYGVTFQEI